MPKPDKCAIARPGSLFFNSKNRKIIMRRIRIEPWRWRQLISVLYNQLGERLENFVVAEKILHDLEVSSVGPYWDHQLKNLMKNRVWKTLSERVWTKKTRTLSFRF